VPVKELKKSVNISQSCGQRKSWKFFLRRSEYQVTQKPVLSGHYTWSYTHSSKFVTNIMQNNYVSNRDLNTLYVVLLFTTFGQLSCRRSQSYNQEQKLSYIHLYDRQNRKGKGGVKKILQAAR